MENEIFNLFTAFQTVFYENFTFFIVTMVMLLFDILSGMAAHFHKKDFNTSALREGLWHKFGYIMIISLVIVLQTALYDPKFHLNFEFPLFDITCGFIIFMEVISIIENVGIINPTIGDFVTKYLNKKEVK